jgi:hypothetical protein
MALEQPYVFLSYSSTDRARVLPIIEKLQAAGARVWIDIVGIPPGGNYGLEIAKAIQGSALVVLACTAAAMQSRNVKQEIQLAWKHHRPYLPLLLEPIDVTPEIEYWLEGHQWVQVYDTPEEQWLPPVMRALEEAGIPVVPPRPRTVVRTPSTPMTVIAPISTANLYQVGVQTSQLPTVAPSPVPAPGGAARPAAPTAAPSTVSREPAWFLLPAMAGTGALLLAVTLFLVLALSRGDGASGGATPPNPGSAALSQPVASEVETAGARAMPNTPGGTPEEAGVVSPAPPAQPRMDSSRPARVMPMGADSSPQGGGRNGPPTDTCRHAVGVPSPNLSHCDGRGTGRRSRGCGGRRGWHPRFAAP